MTLFRRGHTCTGVLLYFLENLDKSALICNVFFSFTIKATLRRHFSPQPHVTLQYCKQLKGAGTISAPVTQEINYTLGFCFIKINVEQSLCSSFNIDVTVLFSN